MYINLLRSVVVFYTVVTTVITVVLQLLYAFVYVGILPLCDVTICQVVWNVIFYACFEFPPAISYPTLRLGVFESTVVVSPRFF